MNIEKANVYLDYLVQGCTDLNCRDAVNIAKKAVSFRTPAIVTKIEKYQGLDKEWHKNHYCPTCDRYVNEKQNACSYCGQLLKW